MRSSNKRTFVVYTSACCTMLLLASLGIFRPIGVREAAVIFFLETGQILQIPTESETEPTEPAETQPPELSETQPPETQPEQLPLFSAGDAALVKLQNLSGYDTDVEAWLEHPLNWELQQSQPTVLILHSHGTESYADTKSDNYRSLNTGKNVVSVGEALARLLEKAGIGVIHDKSMHDSPSYDDSYPNSRRSAQAYLDKYPTIQLVLDLHRDSMMDSSGNQIRYALETDRGTAAKMMFVVGTDAGGQSHEKWPENMSLAVKLQALLEKQTPGICRPINFRTQRFNQDLSTGAVLVEMGSAANSREEVLRSVQLLADAIIALSKGTE